jgi:hypothetical protein
VLSATSYLSGQTGCTRDIRMERLSISDSVRDAL